MEVIKMEYRVEGYDKDNGVYVEYWKGTNLEKAKEICDILDKIARKDELIRYCSSEKFGLDKEPIDWVQVTGGNDEMVYIPR